MKNKICHISTAHNRKDVRIFYKECLSLQANGYDVNVIVSDGEGDGKDHDVSIFDTRVRTKRRWLRMTQGVWATCRMAIKIDADIYHFHDPELLPLGLLLKLKRKKVIYDVHEDTPKQILSKEWLPKYLRNVVAYIFNKFEKNISRVFDVVITATPTIKSLFIKFNKNSEVVYNYPLLEEMISVPSWSNKKRAVCYVGGITKVRGIEELVNSLDLVDVTLVLAGAFSDVELKNNVASLPGWIKVDYRGFVDRAKVYEIFNVSMAGVVTLHPIVNYVDSLPIKMFEYMSAGIPVIASDFPLWREIIDNNKCGICVDPNNPKEIAQAINYIVNNESEAEKMGANGKKAVQEKYNWNSEAEKLLNMYRKLL